MSDEALSLEKDVPLGGRGGDPFGGGSHQISWPRSVGVGQLQHEITQALGPDVRIAVSIPTDGHGGDHEVCEQHRLEIYVSPSSAGAGVQKLLSAHRPDPYYGMSAAEIERVQLEEKIRSGAALTMAEMQSALRLLLG
ncbi:hypothetical protein ACWD7M_16550 [Streptomyces griseus]